MLQRSAAIGAGSINPRSVRSMVFWFEMLGLSAWGLGSLVWCWNFRRGEARRRAPKIAARTLLVRGAHTVLPPSLPPTHLLIQR